MYFTPINIGITFSINVPCIMRLGQRQANIVIPKELSLQPELTTKRF